MLSLSINDLDEDNQSTFSLTPRSRETCAKEGILVEELFFRPVQYFFDQTESEQIVRMRWEHFEGNRRKKIEFLKTLLLQEDFGSSSPTQSLWTNESSGENEGMDFKLAALTQKHKDEVSKMLLQEFQAQLMFEKSQKALAGQIAHENARLELKKQKDFSRDENYKVQEMQRIGSERLAEPNMIQSNYTPADKNNENQIQKQQKMLAKRRELERAERIKEMRCLVEIRQEEEKRKLELRRVEMDQKDAARRLMFEQQRARMAAMNERKRVETEERIQAAIHSQHEQLEQERFLMAEKQKLHKEKLRQLEQQRQWHRKRLQIQAQEKRANMRHIAEFLEQQEADKRLAFERKALESQERLRALSAVKAQEEQKRKRMIAEKEQKRYDLIERAHYDEEYRKAQILAKQQALEASMRTSKDKKMEEHKIKLEREHLKKQDRLEAVERLRRKEEFNTIIRSREIQHEDQRMAKRERKKREAYMQRMLLKQEMKIQQELVKAGIEQLRKTGKWVSPPGLGFDLDIEEIKSQAAENIEKCTSPSSRLTPIRRKYYPFSPSPKSIEELYLRNDAPHASEYDGQIDLYDPASSRRPPERVRPFSARVAQRKPLDDQWYNNHHRRPASAKQQRVGWDYQEQTFFKAAPGLDDDFQQYDRIHISGKTKRLGLRKNSIRQEHIIPFRNEEFSGRNQRFENRQGSKIIATLPHSIGWINQNTVMPDDLYVSLPKKNKKRRKLLATAVMVPQVDNTLHHRMRMIKNLQQEQNEYLLSVLEEEQALENTRQLKLRNISDALELENAENEQSLARLQASKRIMEVTSAHEEVIALRMQALGLSRSVL